MQSIIKGVLFTVLLGFFTVAVAQQLPPEVQVGNEASSSADSPRMTPRDFVRSILPFITFLLIILAVGGKTWAGNKFNPNEQQGGVARAWAQSKWLWNNITIWGKLIICVAVIGLFVSFIDQADAERKTREIQARLDSTHIAAKNVKGTIDSVEANLPSHFNRIAGKVDSVQDSVEVVKGEVNNVQDSVEVVKGEVNNVQDSVEVVKGEVNNVQDSVEVVKGEVNNVQDSVEVVKGEVNNVQDSVEVVKGEVNNVQDSVEVVKGEVNNVQDSVEVVKGEVNNVQDSVEVVKGEVNNVQDSVEVVKGEVNNVQDSVEVVKGKVSSVQDSVKQLLKELRAIHEILQDSLGATSSQE